MSRRERLALLLVLALAAALRLAHVSEHARTLGLDARRLPGSESAEVHETARALLEGGLLEARLPRPLPRWKLDVAPAGRWVEWSGHPATLPRAPLLPLLVAASYAAFDTSPLAAHLVPLLLGLATVWLTWLLARRVGGPRAAAVAALLVAFAGPLVARDVVLLRDAALVPALLLVALLADRAVSVPRPRAFVAVGAALGLLTLTDEIGLPLAALAALALLAGRRPLPQRARAAAALAAGVVLVLSPVLVRNALVGAPVHRLFARGPGELVAGLVRGHDGVGGDLPTDEVRRVLMESNARPLRATLLALGTHRGSPGELAALWGGKARALVAPTDVPRAIDLGAQRSRLATLRLLPVDLARLAPLAALGLLLGLRRPRRLAGLLATLAGTLLVLLALPVDGASRLPLLPFAAVLAGLAVERLLAARAERRGGPLLVGLLVVPAVALALPPRPRPPDPLTVDIGLLLQAACSGQVETGLRLASGLADGGSTAHGTRALRGFGLLQAAAAAADEAEGALATGQGLLELLQLASRQDLLLELAARAEASFQRALELRPDIVGAYHGLGKLAHELERSRTRGGGTLRTGVALNHYLQELRLHPGHGQAHWDTSLLLHLRGDKIGTLKHALLAARAGLDHAELHAAIAQLSCDRSLQQAGTIRLERDAVPAFDLARAADHARRAMERAPHDPLVLEYAATALFFAGDYAGAAEALRHQAGLLPAREAELRDKIEALLAAAVTGEAPAAEEALPEPLAPEGGPLSEPAPLGEPAAEPAVEASAGGEGEPSPAPDTLSEEVQQELAVEPQLELLVPAEEAPAPPPEEDGG